MIDPPLPPGLASITGTTCLQHSIAAAVDVQRAVPGLDRDVADVAVGLALRGVERGGVVEQHVDAAEALDHRGDHRPDLVL